MGTGKRVSFEGDPPDLPPPERSENDANGEEEKGTDGSEDGGGEEGARGELEAQRGAEEEEDEEEEGDEEELEGDDLFDAFMIAADKGQVKRLERLLDRDDEMLERPDPSTDSGRQVLLQDVQHEFHFSSLVNAACMQAAARGQNEVVKMLLRRGASVNMTDERKYTALMLACRGGHVEVVRTLLDARAQVWARNVFGYTCLMGAAASGSVECLKELLRQPGARGIVNCVDATGVPASKSSPQSQQKDGKTALYMACINGHESCVRLLVEEGGAVPGGKEKEVALKAGHEGMVWIIEELYERPYHLFKARWLRRDQVTRMQNDGKVTLIPPRYVSARAAKDEPFPDVVVEGRAAPATAAAGGGKKRKMMDDEEEKESEKAGEEVRAVVRLVIEGLEQGGMADKTFEMLLTMMKGGGRG